MRFNNLLAVGLAAIAAIVAVKLVNKRETELRAEWREVANDEAERPAPASDDAPDAVAAEPPAAEVRAPIDPTTIANAEDFKNWDELGCQG